LQPLFTKSKVLKQWKSETCWNYSTWVKGKIGRKKSKFIYTHGWRKSSLVEQKVSNWKICYEGRFWKM